MKWFSTACLIALATNALCAQEADLAKKLANPVADLISGPIQSNLDFHVGPGGGTISRTNVQPVIPLSLNSEWNVISRTILPILDQEGLDFAGSTDAFGLGDTLQSFFFSPKLSNPIWGIGPALLIPTATDEMLGGEQWGLGPTAVVLKQQGAWTFGALGNHLWDIADSGGHAGVNATFLQPFVSYITPTKTTFTFNSESTYDWGSKAWNIPLNFVVSQLLKIGDQPVQFFAGVRYYVETPEGGPDWGLRFGLTLLFPKS